MFTSVSQSAHIAHLHAQCVTQNIPCISTKTQDFLVSYILKHRPRRLCEVGCAIGYSTCVLADTIASYTDDFHIDSFDISYPHYHQAIQNTLPWKNNISLYHGNFLDIPIHRIHQSTYDMIYIDGRKSEYLAYMHHLSSATGPLTTFILDDVYKYKSKMNDLYEYLKNLTIPYDIHMIEWDDGLMEIPYGFVIS